MKSIYTFLIFWMVLFSYVFGQDPENMQDLTDPVGTGIITARSSYKIEENDQKAFDNLYNSSNGTKWVDGSDIPTEENPCWIQIKLPYEVLVNKLVIVSANDVPDRDPENFRLKASNDESPDWNIAPIGSWTNEVFSERYQYQEFSFSNEVSYTTYRLEITKNKGNSLLTQLAEIMFFGPSGYYVLVVENGSGSGYFQENTIVEITADAPEKNKLFDKWIGDTEYVSDIDTSSTSVTIPANDVNIAASYAVNPLLISNQHVGTGQSFSTIQEAVDASGAGDTIFVHSGIYREEVSINVDGITIRPYQNDTVVINACQPVFNWNDEGNGVYSASVDWDINEGGQSNQVFIDGEMIHLTRWPDAPGSDLVNNPNLAVAEGADFIGNGSSGSYYNPKIVDITDEDFDDNPGRWQGAKVWINLSNPLNRKDGMGISGEVISVNGSKIRVMGSEFRTGDVHWGIDEGTRFFMFDPTPQAVEESGGVSQLLSSGEWWKNGNVLYVKTRDGNPPASAIGEPNLVEVRKFLFAFKPSEEKKVLKDVTIKGFHLFGNSITTDADYYSRSDISNASNNVIDGIRAKYLTHYIRQADPWGKAMAGFSGIILSGKDNTIKNSVLDISAASLICVFGQGNKVLNNLLINSNYSVSENGAINCHTMHRAPTLDHEIAYNTIYNTTHAAIDIGQLENSDINNKGIARIHHNLIHDCAFRTHDVGVIETVGNDGKWVRIDHNIIYNATNYQNIGIYIDFGEGPADSEHESNEKAHYIIDHNLVYNVDVPIVMNHSSYLWVYNNTGISSSVYDVGGFRTIGKDSYIYNNLFSLANNVFPEANIQNNFKPSNSYFIDPTNGDFRLKSTATNLIDVGLDVAPYNDIIVGKKPDIGAFEYGTGPWQAGYLEKPIIRYKVETSATNGNLYPTDGLYLEGDTLQFIAVDETGYGFLEWGGDFTGNENPKMIALSSDISATAIFQPVPTYNLSVTATNGYVKLDPPGGTYNTGKIIQLLAQPDYGYDFDYWEGDNITDPYNDTTTVSITDSDLDIIAHFSEKPKFNITIHTENGTVVIEPEGNTHYRDTKIRLKAFPDDGYEFAGWQGGGITSTSGAVKLTLTEDIEVTALFVSTTSVEDANTENLTLKLHPNPANIHVIVSAGKNIDHYEVYDETGNLMISEENFNYKSTDVIIDISDLKSNASYFLRIKSGNRMYTKKFIKD